MSFKWWTADEENPINSKRITFWCTISSSIYISQVVAVAIIIIRSFHLITCRLELLMKRCGEETGLSFVFSGHLSEKTLVVMSWLYFTRTCTCSSLPKFFQDYSLRSHSLVSNVSHRILLVFHRHHQLCDFFCFVSQGGINCRINRPLTSVFNEL